MIISWNTTNRCNMFCKHCYRESGSELYDELSTKEAKKLINEIKYAGFNIMIFSGGEPLMREDILELIRYAEYVGLKPVLGSNGTMLTEKLAYELKNAGIKVIGISLDSMNAEKHDTLREYDGAWKKGIKGMDICRTVGIPFQIHTTVMNWNYYEIGDIYNFAVKKNAAAYHLFFLIPTGRALGIESNILKSDEYESLLRKIIEKQRNADIEIKPTCAPQFMRMAKEKNIYTRFSRGCLAGISYCIIAPNGDIQPCAYLNVPVGNVREDSFYEIWKNNDLLKNLRSMEYTGKCGDCKYKKLCGGCRARAFFYKGNYLDEDPWCTYKAGRDSDSG